MKMNYKNSMSYELIWIDRFLEKKKKVYFNIFTKMNDIFWMKIF